MYKVRIQYAIGSDFMKLGSNSDLLILDSVKDLKSFLSPSDFNEFMWGVYFIYDNHSYYYNMDLPDRIAFVDQNWIRKPFFSVLAESAVPSDVQKKFLVVIEDYCKLQTNCKRRTFQLLSDKLDKRNRFLQDLEYDIDTLEKIDRALRETPALMKQLIELERVMIQEEESSDLKKGGDVSLLAKGKLDYFLQDDSLNLGEEITIKLGDG